MTTAAAREAVGSLEMGSVGVERRAEGNLLSPAQLFSFPVIGLSAELGCLPWGHLPWELVSLLLEGKRLFSSEVLLTLAS